MSAGADVEKAGLPTGTEALIGRIICTVGKKSLWGHEAENWNPLRHSWPLVHQLHGPKVEELPQNVSLETIESLKVYYLMKGISVGVYLHASGL